MTSRDTSKGNVGIFSSIFCSTFVHSEQRHIIRCCCPVAFHVRFNSGPSSEALEPICHSCDAPCRWFCACPPKTQGPDRQSDQMPICNASDIAGRWLDVSGPEVIQVFSYDPSDFMWRIGQPFALHRSSLPADKHGIDDRGACSVYVDGCAHFRRTGKGCRTG